MQPTSWPPFAMSTSSASDSSGSSSTVTGPCISGYYPSCDSNRSSRWAMGQEKGVCASRRAPRQVASQQGGHSRVTISFFFPSHPGHPRQHFARLNARGEHICIISLQWCTPGPALACHPHPCNAHGPSAPDDGVNGFQVGCAGHCSLYGGQGAR